MPWLVVLGTGSWRPDREHHFKAGVHEVSPEMATTAREARLRMLVVLDEEPIIEQDVPGEPLSLTDLKYGNAGIKLAQPERVEVEPVAIPRNHTCLYCGETFPHPGPLRRHVERNHAPDPEDEETLE